ncbi:hypothetical protein Tco_1055155 [Tanacetum coccineum]|uniref:Reverse transcriptase domain-containing protein n=1 Tax=Tanacetum coccineum TaxID=301880 RepID=A0ABQ5H161_9ASTR
MSIPKFVETHNLVAFLEKPEESNGFEEIIDFLNTSSVQYALTVNLTIYTTCIEQFWIYAKAKTVNGERQIQRPSRQKEELERMGYENLTQNFSSQWKFLIHTILQCLSAKTTAWNEFSSTMASVIICLCHNPNFNFSKYIFDNMMKNLEGGVKFLMYPRFVQVFLDKQVEGMTRHKEVYVTPSHTKKVFANIKRPGKGFSGRVTPIFPTMMIQVLKDMGKDSDSPSDSHSTPIISQPSSSKPQKKKSRRKQRKCSGHSQSWLKRLRKVGSTSRVESSNDVSLGDQLDASKQGRKIADLDADAEVTLVDETQEMNDDNLMFDTDVLEEQEKEVAEKEVPLQFHAPTTAIDEITLAQTLIEIKAAKPKAVTTAATTTTTTRPKARGVVVQEPSEFRTTTSSPQASQPSKTKDKGKAIMIEPEVPLKKKDQVALDEEMARNLEAQLQAELIEEERLARKKEEEANIALIESWENTQAMMEADRLLAERLQTREQEELTDEEKAKLFMEFMEKRRKHFAALRAQEKRNRPPTKTQKRNQMSIYLKHMSGYKYNQLKGRSYDEIQKLFDKEMKRVNSFVPMNSKAQEINGKKDESSSKKKQKTDENEEVEVDNEAKLKMLMVIVKDDDIAIDAIPLATIPLSENEIESPWILSLNFQGQSSEYDVIWVMIEMDDFLVVLADAAECVRDAIGFESTCISRWMVKSERKCLADASLHVPLDEIKVDKTLRFVEKPVEIMDREIRKLKRRKVVLVKVRWNSKRGPEFTWEHEDQMRIKYPQLFVDRVVEPARGLLAGIHGLFSGRNCCLVRRITCGYPWPELEGKRFGMIQERFRSSAWCLRDRMSTPTQVLVEGSDGYAYPVYDLLV